MSLLRRARLPLVLAIALVLLVSAACSDDDDDASSSDESASAVPECLTFADLYALSGPESEGFSNWQDAQELATELGSTTELPDLDLTITAPGEESGTYGSYIELALEGIGETRAEEGVITEDQAATTRKDYESSGNDNVIIEGVGGSEGSFGWVGFAFADQNSDTVRSIEVDGGEGCVAPTPDTIADNSYPLSRPLFIYLNTAKAASNAAVAGYVDFYLSDDGIASVEEADYIGLDDAALQTTRDAWTGAGIAAPSGEVSGTVSVSGSSTVEPISALVAEKYSAANPNLNISVAGPGTSDGIEQFCAGEIDVADASRAMDEEEVAACTAAGVEFVELQVGIDGLSVITQA